MRAAVYGVTGMKIFSRVRADERGVTAIVVAVCLIAIFGAAVLSIDAGQLWAVRRRIITGTDAAALNQATSFALNPATYTGSCNSNWSTILSANSGDTFNSACNVRSSTSGQSGVAIVSSYKRSGAIFSGALGIGSSAAFSQSASMWGFVTQLNGLRPIGLCTYDANVEQGLQLHGKTETYPPVAPNYTAPDNSTDYAVRTPGVVFHTSFVSECQGASGNFGWLNLGYYGNNHQPPLDCNANGGDGNCTHEQTGQIADWLLNGYFGNQVSLSPSDCDASYAGNQGCNGDPGTKSANAIQDAMHYLVNPSNPGVVQSTDDPHGPNKAGNPATCGSSTCNPLPIPIVLCDGITSGGASTDWHVIGVAYVRIWNYCISNGNGACAGGRFLDVEYVNGLFSGECCSANPPVGSGQAPPPRGDKICDVDHDPADPNLTASRCTLS